MEVPLGDVMEDGEVAEVREVGVSGVLSSSIDCATACVEGCRQPDACPSAEARARVEALLGSRSLDELVEIAASTAESRGRERILRDLGTLPNGS